jgi:hypothetical protein
MPKPTQQEVVLGVLWATALLVGATAFICLGGVTRWVVLGVAAVPAAAAFVLRFTLKQ